VALRVPRAVRAAPVPPRAACPVRRRPVPAAAPAATVPTPA
jgi:hypothetical protein